MKDVARVAAAIDKAFSSDKINYGTYSDKMTHLHYHIVSKYEGGPRCGKVHLKSCQSRRYF